jgi:hypothetical protein
MPKVTFDPTKRIWTLQHRGLDFAADAPRLFADRKVTTIDDRFDYGEVRYITAGHVGGRMVVAVWTWRGDARHIISMRHCHAKEEARWTEIIGQTPDD